MNALQWMHESGNEPLRAVYVVHGEDPYLMQESLAAIARSVCPDGDSAAMERVPGSEASLADVLDRLFTLPFFSSRRLVVVDDADPFVSKHRGELEAYVEHPARTGVLVLQAKTWPANTRLAKAVEKLGLTIQATSPRESDLPSWLVRLAKTSGGVKLNVDAARLVVELVGPEPGILAGEIEKLIAYAGESRSITRDDVVKLVGAGRIETIWKILDAAAAGNSGEAIRELDLLLAAGEPATPMLAAMSANLMRLHHAGFLRGQRMSLGEACQAAGIPPFAVDKTRRQHAHLGPKRTDSLPALLLKADLDTKGGSLLEPRVILEILLARLAAPRLD